MHHIEQLQYIKTPASKVYETLTTQDGLSAVWTEKLIVKPEPGFVNVFDFDDNYATKMKIVELIPNQRIVWDCIESDAEWTGTSVSFDIREKKKDAVEVVLKHLNWRDVTDYYRSCSYNWAMFLYSLKSYCEDGQGMNFQQRKF